MITAMLGGNIVDDGYLLFCINSNVTDSGVITGTGTIDTAGDQVSLPNAASTLSLGSGVSRREPLSQS